MEYELPQGFTIQDITEIARAALVLVQAEDIARHGTTYEYNIRSDVVRQVLIAAQRHQQAKEQD